MLDAGASQGYYRFPTIHGDRVVFVSEDDLWEVPAQGGTARRLTANLGAISFPAFSPDGRWLAFTGREEGVPEVYAMPSEGGPVRRLTHLGGPCAVLGWSPDGLSVLFASDYGQPVARVTGICSVPLEGGLPEALPFGHAVAISFGPGGRCVLGRNNTDPARWKRYRGGTAGELIVDAEGNGEFRRLIELNGNLARPMWIGERIYFVSDHEGIGNLYSCLPDGGDLRRETHQREFYARFPSSDGRRIVYHAGADLFVYDPESRTDRKLEVQYRSPRTQRQRKFVDAARYLESVDLHPKGHSLAVVARGKSFTMGAWEGSVVQQNPAPTGPYRTRLTTWLPDGKRVVCVADRDGADVLELHEAKPGGEVEAFEGLDIGRVEALSPNPKRPEVALGNHRHELLVVNLETREVRAVARSAYQRIQGFDWSPDGRWLAYGFGTGLRTCEIRLWNSETGESVAATKPELQDTHPSFDPEGKYLYFLGARTFNPVYDGLHFDLGFPKGVKPCLIVLDKEGPDPFRPLPGSEEGDKPADPESKKEEEPKDKPTKIDLEGLADRVLAFPVPEGRYAAIRGMPGKALVLSFPAEGAADQELFSQAEPKGALHAFDFKEQELSEVASGLSGFGLSLDRKTMVLLAGNRVRVLPAGQKPDPQKGDAPGRKSGWVDLSRVRVCVDPNLEWPQMAREAWLLQREFFWTADMSRVDWDRVWERYRPLIDRVNTRGEFSDLVWEMQGELGTSHAYEFGGDYRPEPAYGMGFLGAEFEWDGEDAYLVRRILRGTPGVEPKYRSPLLAPGVGLSEGDRVVAVEGVRVAKERPPQAMLVNRAGMDVSLTVRDRQGAERDVVVRTLRSETPLRYREWVESNRRWVHERTDGRVGYVHIPNMGADGFAEFHRTSLTEWTKDGLIVDVRFNGGGHVSPLLLEKLNRKRIGYDVSRWGSPEPYPEGSVDGPMVAITNQFAGSDDDIFSHCFKLMKLGNADRQAHLGRGDRDLAAQPAGRRHDHVAAGVLVLVRGRRLGSGELRHGSRHRGGYPAAGRAGGARSSAGEGSGAGPGGAGAQPSAASGLRRPAEPEPAVGGRAGRRPSGSCVSASKPRRPQQAAGSVVSSDDRRAVRVRLPSVGRGTTYRSIASSITVGSIATTLCGRRA
ncbi:MAG: PDZ domain-containing protein [Fimbriimonadales bacterium]|nr:PDZ domain-containing protein [Fimbriimonadales bacterium]